MHNKSIRKSILLWLLANLFFAFQFILRLSAGILREDIIQKFSIDAASFGTLAGYYYLGYSSTQIPLGIMLDRLSFRLVTSLSIATSAVGTMMFVTSNNWDLLLFGRFLIGAGSGVAFLAIAKIIKIHFNEKFHSMLIGLSFSFGLTGAVFGSTPMKLLFERFGYDHTFNILTLIGFALAAMMLIFGKLETNENTHNSASDTVKSVLKLVSNPTIILIGVSGGLMVGALEGFADVWAIPFFNQVFNMSATQSTTITSFIYIGMCFGGPILALSAILLRSANLMIFLTGLLTIAIFAILFYLPPLSFIMSAGLMFTLGILCCYQVLVFTVVSNQVEASSAGLAIAITNCINTFFGYFFHTSIGNAFQSSWDGSVSAKGNALYSIDNFIYALAIIPICCFIGQFGFVFLTIKSRKKN